MQNICIDKKETTDIEKVINISIDEDDSNLLELVDINKIIFDLTISLKTRLMAIDKFRDGDELVDIINRIGTMYMFSESKIIEKYLYEIVFSTRIYPFLKLLAAKHLKEYSEKGYDCYDYLCTIETDEFPLVSKIDCMCVLLENKSYRKNGLKYLETFFNDKNIDCYYRYKTIIGISKLLGQDIKDLIKKFIENEDNLISYRILACQYILVEYKEDSKEETIDISTIKTLAENKLLSFLEDHKVSYNSRADACDILLQYGQKESKELAAMVLENLSKDGKLEIRTIYENAQNVHTKSIEESANKILGELSLLVEEKLSFDIAREQFREFYENKENNYSKETIEGVNSSLNRIQVDRAFYGKVNMSLTTIFCKVWSYIKTHEFSVELKKRLVEELEHTNGVCGTGYVTNILNALSGMTDLSLTISFEDQVIANLGARLTKEINKLEDEDLRDKIIEEMMIPSQYYKQRPAFLSFFRENISKIREDLYQEFKDYMSDTDYDLYTRRAIFKYQGDYMV